MNRLRLFFRCLSLLVAMVTGHSVSAQQTAPQLLPPPARGSWEISYRREPASTSPPKIKSRDYTVDGSLGKCVTHYGDGRTVTAYIIGSIGVEENSRNPRDLIINDFSSPGRAEFLKSYPGLTWIRARHYRGVVEFRGVPCHYFFEGNATETEIPGSESSLGREAWFGMDLRPVACKERDLVATFAFRSSPALLEIPEQVRAKARRHLDSLAPQTLSR